MEYYQVLLTVYMCISLITCIIVSRKSVKYKNSTLILAPIILWLGLITETAGWLHNEFINYYSGWIFNIYGFFFFMLFYIMIFKYLKSERNKMIVTVVSIISLLFYIVRFFLMDNFYDRMIYADSLCVFTLIILTSLYAVEILKSNEVITLKNHPEFFFIGGYLIFHLVYTPLNVAYDMKLRLFTDEFYILLKSIQGYVLIAMNFLFIFGFTWTTKVRL